MQKLEVKCPAGKAVTLFLLIYIYLWVWVVLFRTNVVRIFPAIVCIHARPQHGAHQIFSLLVEKSKVYNLKKYIEFCKIRNNSLFRKKIVAAQSVYKKSKLFQAKKLII